MNAYELADELDKYKGIATRDAAKMLRQQQTEIQNLKAGLFSQHDIHSAKELSDEEIEQIAIRYYVGSRILPIQYARAIIKASRGE